MPTTARSTTQARIRHIPVADASRWRECVDRMEHDFYHSAEYHRFCEESGEGQAFLAVYQEGTKSLLWPYLLRPIEGFGDDGLGDVTSVYGYPGPLGRGGAEEPNFLNRAFDSLVELWHSQRAVCAFTRLHPVLENDRFLPPGHRSRVQGQTVSVDLTAEPEKTWRTYRKQLRCDIRKARDCGFEVSEEHAARDVEQFTHLYRETMNRNQAARGYHFGYDYFRRFLEQLGPSAHLLTARRHGLMAAGAIFVEWQGIVEYHFSATGGEYLRCSPAKLLLDEIRRWGHLNGCGTLHLGGGRAGRSDGLFSFKAAFSPRRHAFHTWRHVLDPTVYCELSAIRRRQAGQKDAVLDESFFPLYRSLSEPASRNGHSGGPRC